MKYVQTTHGSAVSYAACEDETAAALAAAGGDVIVSDTPFLPQIIAAARDEIQVWVRGRGLSPFDIGAMTSVSNALTAIGAATSADQVAAAVAALTAVTSENLAPAIRRECEGRIKAVLGSSTVQASMLREVGYLNSLVASGVALSADQLSDAAMLGLINAWEAAMVETRELLIAAADATYGADRHWPSAPDGVAAFLTGF